jgi:hypothetical protein
MSQPEMGQPEPGQPEPEAADQVLQWITLLQGNVDEYGGQLSLDDFDGFQASLQEIAGTLRDHPDQAAGCRTNLIELVGRYPSVGQWLVGMDPAYRDLPGVDEPLATEPVAEPAVEPEGPPGSASRSQAGTAVTAVAVPAPAPAPAIESVPVPAPAPVAAGVADDELDRLAAATRQQQDGGGRRSGRKKQAPAKAVPRNWTPDVLMQVGKEVVTAIIALIIIGSTIALVARSFGLIGNSSHINQAKDLLSIMLGLVGTVIGYYFGRTPADARATAATTRADQATAEKEHVKARARSLADDLDGIMAPTALNSLTRGEVGPHQAKLQSVRDSLRDMSAL